MYGYAMLKSAYEGFKINYLDVIDPDRSLAKICLRTALACFLCIIIFQLLGYPKLSAWSGFAAFSIGLNDTPQSVFSKRIIWLIGITLFFGLITFLGMLLSPYEVLFIVFVPIVVFPVALSSCYGINYLTIGGWSLFIFVLAGSADVSFQIALIVFCVFLFSGIITIVVCCSIFSYHPRRQIFQNFVQLLEKLNLLLSPTNGPKIIITVYQQTDHILQMLDTNFNFFVQYTRLSQDEQLYYVNLIGLFQQMALLTKSALVFRLTNQEIIHCRSIITHLFSELITQLNHGKLPDFETARQQLEEVRLYLHNRRVTEVAKDKPDFSPLFIETNYYYHYVKIENVAEQISSNLERLQHA